MYCKLYQREKDKQLHRARDWREVYQNLFSIQIRFTRLVVYNVGA